jgi:DNA-binding transcriptional LysR family regulator
MSDIDEIVLRRLDLTVLLVFLGLMRHRKALDVAGQMGLTQSSISHSLKRLRDAFGDPLFLRRPHGLEPTAVAVALEPKIRLVVDTLAEAMKGEAEFDPSTNRSTVVLGSYDNQMATILPSLLKRLCHAAPGMRMIVKTVGRQDAIRALEAGDIDLALGYLWSVPETCLSEHLYEDGYLVVLRQGNSLRDLAWTAETYAAAKHLVVSPAGKLSGIVDLELERHGLSRQVVVAVPLFFAALATVAATDLIATLPSRIVRAHAAGFGLLVRDPPIPVRPFPVSATRHRRNARSGLHAWLVEQVRQSL